MMFNVKIGHLHAFLKNIKSLPPAIRQQYTQKRTYIPVPGSVLACLGHHIFTITLLFCFIYNSDIHTIDKIT